MFLPPLLCAGSALRCTQAQQGFGPSCGTREEGQAQQVAVSPSAPAVHWSGLASQKQMAPQPCLAVSWQGVMVC